MLIRDIEKSDNQEVANLIREVLTEYGANRPGFAWQDPELGNMSAAYQQANNAKQDRSYKVIEYDGAVVGGGGFGSFHCDEYPMCCELQKMYLYPKARGRGWGRTLIEELIEEARRLGYDFMYLESLNSMSEALNLYRKQGFKSLEQPLGNSGHNACDAWLIKRL